MVTSAHAVPRPDDTTGFQQYWLAETIRLRESQWGPLQDSNETRRARALGDSFTQRLLLRAIYLGRREGIDLSIKRWITGAKLAFGVMLVLALLTGAAAAVGALGDGTRQVNIVLALTALMGLHIVTFLFWCAGSLIPYGGSHTGLGDLWLWLTRKLARGPDAALIPRALVGLLARHSTLRPLLGAISHAVWSVALLAMLVTLVALLSARRYTFNWETTLLTPDAFVGFTRSLGWLPSKLGFDIPSEAIIRASDGLHTVPDYAQAQWSSWLIGCLICYGLLPRLLALLATAITSVKQIRTTALDIRLPGYIELRDRLDPPSLPGGIDAPVPPSAPVAPVVSHRAGTNTQQAIVGLELASDDSWPPGPLTSCTADLGVIDNRQQRQDLLDFLATASPTRLLIVCDGRQTPDRGLVALIRDITSMAEQVRVLVWNGQQPATPAPSPSLVSDTDAGSSGSAPLERHSVWAQQILNAGLTVQDVYFDVAPALTWLDTVRAQSTRTGTP